MGIRDRSARCAAYLWIEEGGGASKEPREQRRSDRVCELSEYVVSALFWKCESLLYIQLFSFADASLDVEHLKLGAFSDVKRGSKDCIDLVRFECFHLVGLNALYCVLLIRCL